MAGYQDNQERIEKSGQLEKEQLEEEERKKREDSIKSLSFGEKEDKVEEAIEEAKQLRKSGEYNEGIQLLVDSLQYDVLKDRVYYRLGNIYYDADDLERAEYAYKRAIEENDKHVNAQFNLSVVYKDQGRVSESVKQRKKATKIEAKNPRDVDLDEDQREWLKGCAWKAALFALGGIGALAGIIYLVTLLV